MLILGLACGFALGACLVGILWLLHDLDYRWRRERNRRPKLPPATSRQIMQARRDRRLIVPAHQRIPVIRDDDWPR